MDTSQWPVVRLTVEGNVSGSEMPQLIEELDDLYEREERFVHLVEIQRFRLREDLAGPFGEWMKRNKDRIRRYNVGVALVSASPFFRFFISTLFLIQPIPTSYALLPTMNHAERWLRERLEAEGIPVPPCLANVPKSQTG